MKMANAIVLSVLVACGALCGADDTLEPYAATLADNVYPKRITCPIIFLSPSVFCTAAGVALPSWKGIREVRLGIKETLPARDGKQDVKLELGADWQGPKPEFHNLR